MALKVRTYSEYAPHELIPGSIRSGDCWVQAVATDALNEQLFICGGASHIDRGRLMRVVSRPYFWVGEFPVQGSKAGEPFYQGVLILKNGSDDVCGSMHALSSMKIVGHPFSLDSLCDKFQFDVDARERLGFKGIDRLLILVRLFSCQEPTTIASGSGWGPPPFASQR